MVKVVATARGYIGLILRDPGNVFDWPDGLKLGSWVKPAAFGGKGDHDGDGNTGGSLPSAPAGERPNVSVPADWHSGSAADRKALAKSITGENVPNAKEADAIIEAFLVASGPEPFGDAPAPEAVASKGNGLQEALGSTQPDWIAPGGSDAPVMAED